MKNTLIAVLIVVFSCFGVRAQDGAFVGLPPKPPLALEFLSSKAALRAYAAELARGVSFDLTSAGFSEGGGYGFGSSWNSPTNLAGIQKQLLRWEYEFPMSNPLDRIDINAKIVSEEWENLFLAFPTSVQAYRENEDDEYTIGETFLYFKLAPEIPVRVGKSIKQARISYIGDDDSTIVNEQLQVRNGKFYFRSDFAGKSIVLLTDDEGNRFAYDLRRGGVMVPIELVQFFGIRGDFEGMYPFLNPSMINLSVWSNDGSGENPTLEVTMTHVSGARHVNVSAVTREGAVATGFLVRQQGAPGTSGSFYPVVPPLQYVPIPFFPGVTYVVPTWNLEEFQEPETVPVVEVPPVGKV
jgi:hypothetical protein